MADDPAQDPTLQSPTLKREPPTSRFEREPPTLQGYALGDVLGKGGMGEVVLAHDPRIGRDVALKRMRADEPSREAIARFVREAKIQARLDHPAIVPVHELGKDAEGRPFFTMKRLAGTTLSANLATATPQRLLRAFVDVCHAIDLAHSRHVVHRDLKPANIMLGDYGEVYVLDWGVARVLDSDDPNSPSHDIPSIGERRIGGGETQTGELLGTPGYMAPEQVKGDTVGPPTDVYALGSILFEILAGVPLHPRGQSALASTLSGAVHSPAKRTPDRTIAPELDALCTEALAEDPTLRPTARQLGDRVQQYLDGDRDTDRRRALAKELVEQGQAALARGDRAGAVRLGGRALAVDPDSQDAGALVLSLVIDPPDTSHPEIESALGADEEVARRNRSRRAIIPYLTPYVLLPLLVFVDIANWTELAMLYAATLFMAGLAWFHARTGRVPIAAYFCAHVVMITMFTRLSGPFILTPMLMCAVLISVTALPWVGERTWVIVSGTTFAVLLPFVLEWTGVLAQTWHMSDEGVVSSGTIFADRTSVVPLLVGNTLLAIAVASYARAISRDRRNALRRLHVQAWHLKQLLPKQAA